MKKLLLLLYLLFIVPVFSQSKAQVRKSVQVLEPQSAYINSATNLGGKTRIYYKIDLPANTVEWYYVFTTTPNPQGGNSDLFKQISSMLTANPFAEIVASALFVDSGIYPVDVFLMNNKSLSEFNKKDIFDSYEYTRPSHYAEGTVLNSKEGKLKINDVNRGSFYIGIRNPSLSTGVNVKIEVVAVVEETVIDYSVWSKEAKETLYASIKSNYRNATKTAEKTESFAVCLMSKITKNYTPQDFANLASYEVTELLGKLTAECGL